VAKTSHDPQERLRSLAGPADKLEKLEKALPNCKVFGRRVSPETWCGWPMPLIARGVPAIGRMSRLAFLIPLRWPRDP
jgi:hypothetical protein